MRKAIVTFALALLGASAGAQDWSLRAELESRRERAGLPALGAAVIIGGELAGADAVGVRAAGSAVGVTRDDLWHLGSCTKAMTATLCATFVEEGLLRWDSTVGEVFADQAGSIHAGWRGVTLAQLLRHRSGMAEDRRPNSLHAQMWALRGPMTDRRRRVVELAFAGEPEVEPGSAMHYSNGGYVIAGAMCERVGGKAWEDLMRERVFGPLGMESAGFGPPGTPGRVDQPRAHRRAGDAWTAVEPGVRADNPAVLGPAGTAHASLADWAKFVALHLAGARGVEGLLLRPESFAAMHEDADGQAYAMGWGTPARDWAGGTAISHSGSNTMWYCVVWAAPERDFAVLVATNCAGDGVAKACDETVWALIQAWRRGEFERAAP
ncbi:MAG: beta-lactamase family protein [Phycisphaeraceae bacterium]|nr:beta-lactamase family protein [Phycisphaeraceae bacterium]